MPPRRRPATSPPLVAGGIHKAQQDEDTAGSSDKKHVKKPKKCVTETQQGRSLTARCVASLKYILLFIIIPPFINYASLQKEYSSLKPTGELYDVGWGQKLFMMCEGKGPPTVILDAPTGMTSDVWTLVWPKLSKHAKVCIYDRAGLGFSERPYINQSQTAEERKYTRNQWQPYTGERMVDDFNQLFTVSSQQPQPFILVGAELGALVSMFYTQLYEGNVLGLVLINPLSERLFEQDQGVWTQYWFGQLIPTYQSFQLGAALGLTRLALMVGILKHPLAGMELPAEVEMRQKYLLCNPRHLSSVVDEHHFINETFSQIKTLRLMKSVPKNISVTLITGNYYDEQIPSPLNKAWAKSEQSLISRDLPHATHIVVNGADHHMLYRDPSAVVEPVIKMIKQYKLRHKHQ
ncbi:uncharacterized protein [Haliotis asinina]|uniref:uncharacterized protein isoform X1 n=1 Tax=Haliotis asinina TaxID=109174 RepID=UPI0035323B41